MALNPVVKDVIDKDTYVILNKQDVISDQTRLDTLIATLKKDTGAKKIWSMSCETGEGVSLFLDQMIDILKTK